MRQRHILKTGAAGVTLAVTGRLKLTGSTTPAPPPWSTTSSTATLKGTRDTSSPMPSGECARARAFAQAATLMFTFD